MRRDFYYSYVSEKIEVMSLRIKSNGKLNILNLNIHAEYFYRDLCSMMFGLNLENANTESQNAAAIDLIDKNKKVLIQVSSSDTKKKVNETLSKDILLDYKKKGYKLKFIFFSQVSKGFRDLKFNNKHGIEFNPNEDIWDKEIILKTILEAKIDKQKDIYDLIKSELGEMPDVKRISTNLADLINLLSEEDLGSVPPVNGLHEFNIDSKIEFNNLKRARGIIKHYRIFFPKINRIYEEFDNQARNKSLSVFNKLVNFYNEELMDEDLNDTQRFINIITKTLAYIEESDNYKTLPKEELEQCVSIIVVDAFIRCKIFENPEGYNYVTA